MNSNLSALERTLAQRTATDRDRRAAAHAEAYHAVAAQALGLPVVEVAVDNTGSGHTLYETTGATEEARAIVTAAHQVGMDVLAPPWVRACESRACQIEDDRLLAELGYGDPFGRREVGRKALALLKARPDQVEELVERLVREGRVRLDQPAAVVPTARRRGGATGTRAARLAAGARAERYAIENGMESA